MTNTEAMGAMRDGHKVRHQSFTLDEWMKETGRLYEFEDGCLCEPDEFWRFRDGDEWLVGWRLIS